ncbi:uncharacterized protein LOC119689629 [Teleopsis dalmanni]|uniref:uncharacterized protein LOC119689629 n=1 Tax=Teleopsis dalmanni TaxID=139649 RepID=UPI0018CCE365|nr:uncharacterized protein LOC119689629 [Teleopsis dalmanni]
MMSSMKYLLAVAIIASLSCSAYAVVCYQCESHSNPNCGEKFEGSNNMKFDCSKVAPPRFLQQYYPSVKNATGCMKKTFESGADRPHIVRSCYFGDVSHSQTGCQSDPSLPFNRQLACDVCAGDLCNGSSTTGPIALAVILFFALARILS